MVKHTGRLFKGTLLISGTTIGGGMLALPVLTSLGGFIPAVVMLFLCWIFMACTGLLTLEAYMWMDGDVNLISMAEYTLGKAGKVFTWILYLFFFYCLSLAYTVGCGGLLVSIFGDALATWSGPLIFTILFAPLIFAGAKIIGKINIILMMCLVLFYFIFVVIGLPHIDFKNLQNHNWFQALQAMPIAFAAFGFHGIIPTLGRYLEKDVTSARIAIVLGSFIPLAAYMLWEFLILGIVPTYGPGGLAEAIKNGSTAVEPLRKIIHNPKVYVVGQFFAFFALVTSYLGVTLGLRDFLADGIGIKKDTKGKILICSFIFIPILIFSTTHPLVFIDALNYAGGYGASLLLGLLPILMVWSGRYKMNLPDLDGKLRGGRPLLIVLALFVAIELITETLYLLKKL